MLTAKEIHKLRKELTLLVDKKDDVTRFCNYANANDAQIIYDDIYLDCSPWERWERLLEKIIGDSGKVIKLLEAIIVEHGNNETLTYFLSELKSRNEIRLRELKTSIQQKKCVIFLGPDVLQIDLGRNRYSFNTYLCQKLKKLLDNNKIYYERQLSENLNYMAQCFTEMPKYIPGDVQRLAKQEFNRAISNGEVLTPLFDMIARIPCKLIINANPDTLLSQHIKAKGHTCLFAYHDISNNIAEEKNPGEEGSKGQDKKDHVIVEKKSNKEGQNIKSIEANEILLYNIFGTFENESSILYTEAQFLEFINKVILGDPSLNSTVLKELNEQESYLFIGFDFEQWYFKVLFQLLRLKKDKAISCNFNINDISIVNREFYEEAFKVYFIGEDLRTFINDLLSRLNN